jgi:hypothetical protein
MQIERSDGPSVYSNDSAIVKSQCPLKWTSVIDEARLLGQYPSTVTYDDECGDPLCSTTDLNPSKQEPGPPPAPPPQVDAHIRLTTISDIVNSRVVAGSDGMTCTSCHTPKSPYPYHPDGPPHEIGKDELFSYTEQSGSFTYWPSKAWSGVGGWASIFVSLHWDYVDCAGNVHNGFVKTDGYLRQLFQKWIDDKFQ